MQSQDSMQPQELKYHRGEEARRLYDALLPAGTDALPVSALSDALERAGLRLDDPRIRETVEALEALDPGALLDHEQFAGVVQPNLVVIDRVLGGRTVIPEFEEFRSEVGRIFAIAKRREDGRVADYIPQLGRIAPDQFGAALCTVDGQRLSLGAATTRFTVQSGCKPISYCLALEEHGADTVHRHIGREPSGASFNELALNREGRPHNPMVNAGAIMSSAFIRPGLPAGDRYEHVVDLWTRLGGGTRPGFSNSTYLSERQTADRNFALGYSMRENRAFPEGTDLIETLEFYMQCCSMEMTVESLSVVAATLAGGGVCPTTGERVLQPETVQMCLSLMDSCGMYDFSGEWAFTIGLPAKSGVSGVLWVVIPNVGGLCTWSPRLDACGNSVRGVAFCEELVSTFSFHNYDNLVGRRADKRDPRSGRVARKADDVGTLCWAASEGDLATLRQAVARGVPADAADYDGRTALHLACSEGRAETVRYLIGLGVDSSPRDRWAGTPLDDALRGGHTEVIELLERGGAARGRRQVMAG
jgi:glutaminase